MAMEIAIGTNVHHDLEAHVRVLKSAPDLVPASFARGHIRIEQLSSLFVIHRAHLRESLVPRAMRLMEENAGENLDLRFRIELHQLHFRAWRARDLHVA